MALGDDSHIGDGQLQRPDALLPRDEAGVLDVDRLLIPLHDEAGEVGAWLAAVPFLRTADLPPPPPEEPDSPDDEESARWRGDPLIRGVASVYAEVLEAARARVQPGQALIASGHLYMRGTAISELSERKILGGNQHAIPRAIFPDDWAYVALGHLHLAQAVEASEQVRYCGSPLPRVTRDGTTVVVPAGSLDDDPAIRPAHHIFWASRAPWSSDEDALPRFDEYPPSEASATPG